jgi:SAM-dependent methyltransferase
MSKNKNSYDIDPHVVELYDAHETQTDDVELIRKLLSGREQLRILEPFCGTGRILIPLAEDGHEMVGLDQSEHMLDRARARIAKLPPAIGKRIELIRADATAGDWPGGFDLVLLGGNCFYELASPAEQESCIASAAAALEGGGYVYVDNDHMEDEIPQSWLPSGKRSTRFPSGTCADGTHLQGTTEILSFDSRKRLWRARRSITMTFPDGTTKTVERIQQKHPVSFSEVKGWMEKYNFVIEKTFGERAESPYTPKSPRAIFWARKEVGL